LAPGAWPKPPIGWSALPAATTGLEAFKVAVAELETASREARAAILARLPDRSDDAGVDPRRRGARDD
jgi:hypothetical protein